MGLNLRTYSPDQRKKKSPDREGQDSSFQRRARAGSGAYSFLLFNCGSSETRT